ncbi:MAG: hypothetical protein LRY50_13565 [Geovibrio sp.]|nr:hypothetical protein [Geovibrio sp.]
MRDFELRGMGKYTGAFRDFFTGNEGGTVLISGSGGSGKSEVLSTLRLMPEVADPSVVSASIDLSLEVNIDSELGLLALRNELIKYYKINFSFFDVAYALYLVRINPNKKLDRDLDLYTNSKIINEVLGVAGAKGNEFVNKLYFTVERGKPAVTEWWKNDGGAELNRLLEETPEAVRRKLTAQWAKDLSLALQGRKCIITIDSFENIYGENGSGRKQGADRWVKELMALLPGVTFVLSGRELPNGRRMKSLRSFADLRPEPLTGMMPHTFSDITILKIKKCAMPFCFLKGGTSCSPPFLPRGFPL